MPTRSPLPEGRGAPTRLSARLAPVTAPGAGESAAAPRPAGQRVRERLSLTAATVGLPLPRSTDWRPADGWLPAGLLACTGGALLAVWLAWSRLAPGSVPHLWRFLGVAAGAAVADLAVAAAYAWRPSGRAAAWRTLTIVTALGGAAWCDPVGLRTRFGFPWALAACLLALGMRAGETLGTALVEPLHARAVRNPFADPPAVDWVPLNGGEAPAFAPTERRDDSPLRASWRLVAEFWLLAAVAGGSGAGAATGPWCLAALACALGGAVLVLGTAVSTLRASWEARGFTYEPAHIPAFWGLGLAVAVAVGALALAVPLPSALLTPAAVRAFLLFLARHRLPAHAAATVVSAGLPVAAPHTPVPIPPGLWGLIWAVLRGAFWSSMGLLFSYPLVAGPVTITVMAVVAFFWARSRRRPQWLALLPRALAAPLRALLEFWAFLRWPRRMRAALARLGWLRPPADADTGRDSPWAPTWYEHAWAWVDPRQAVRLTYRRFLRQAAAAGLPRRGPESPRAYERTLNGAGMAGDHLTGLTEVYEEARFSAHAADRSWPARARRGLVALRARRRGCAAPKPRVPGTRPGRR